MFALGHLNERIGKVRLSGFLFSEPDFVEALSADTTTQVGMELGGTKSKRQLTAVIGTSTKS